VADAVPNLSFVWRVLNSASTIAKSRFGRVGGLHKGDDPNQILTEADLAISRYLIREIQADFPMHNIIDEETGIIDKESEFTWVVDPIDGTSNFVAGLPFFGVQIAVLRDGEPLLGGIALPALGEMLLAERDRGCLMNREPITVPATTDLSDALVAYGIDGHRDAPERTRDECAQLADLVLRVRNLRSSNSVFDAVQVVKGTYGAWINRSTKIWDQVPQHIVLQEAGCVYTDCDGKPMDYSNPLQRVDDNFENLAAPPELHEQLVDVFRR
jgi:myo-inositol-1(or 4)-monophosphatase